MHIWDCDRNEPDNRARAAREHDAKHLSPRRDRTAARAQAYAASVGPSQNPLAPFPSAVQLQTMAGTPVLFPLGFSASPSALSPLEIPSLAGPSGYASAPRSNTPVSYPASPNVAFPGMQSWQNSPALSSSPSASSLLGKRTESPFNTGGSPVKRGRYRGHVLSRQPSGVTAAPPPPPTWDSDPAPSGKTSLANLCSLAQICRHSSDIASTQLQGDTVLIISAMVSADCR